MAKKPKPRQSKSRQSHKEFQKQVSALKRAGLISSKIDVRKQRETKYMRAQIRKFQGVITGKDVAVKVPRSVRRQYAEIATVKNSRVVVPKAALGGRTFYSAKYGQIVRVAKVAGGTVISLQATSVDALRKLEGRNVSFSFFVNRGYRYHVVRAKTIDELERDLFSDSFRKFNNWLKYVNVEFFNRNRDDDDEDIDDEIGEAMERLR